jgi:ABC-type enterochelin transport system permease subunit
MNGLDFLAWAILGAIVVFGVLPALFAGTSSAYEEALKHTFCFILALSFTAVVLFGALWAIKRAFG